MANKEEWIELTLEWGNDKIAAWQTELNGEPKPTVVRKLSLERDISYMSRMLERIEKM